MKKAFSSIDIGVSDKSSLKFLTIENGYKMVIYERELRVYSKTNSITKVFAVKRGTEEKPKWELEFQLKGIEERAVLLTSKNKARQFPKLNFMVEQLNEWCPNLDNLSLDLHMKK